MQVLLFLVAGFFLLRLNSKIERSLAARRTMHSIVSPLSTYLGLLDHELQNETHHVDRLVSQAVLDHVTELRAFLLQPLSRDLNLLGRWSWLMGLNNILFSLEESLEDAIQDGWEDHLDEIKEGVVRLSSFMKDTPTLRAMTTTPVGVVAQKS